MQAQITGDVTGSVTEKGGVANGTAGVATATGNLDVTDSDSPETFVVQSSVTKTYGTFSIDATGAWGYTLDDTNAQVQALPAGATLHELVTVSAADGTTQQIDITINGANDAATITGISTASLREDEITSVSTALTVQDVDAGQAAFQLVSPGDLHGDYGDFAFNAVSGAWSYTLDRTKANVLNGGQVVHETLQVTSVDGTASTTIDVAVTGTAELGPTLDMRDSGHSLDMVGLTFSGFTIVTDPLPTSFSWQNADGFWTITGTGFLYGADGRPTAGTIKSIDVTNGDGQPGLLVTGLALSAAQFAGWVVANAPQSATDFLNAVLAGHDMIWGNDLGDQLKGGAGSDRIFGGAGDDVLIGGSGTDHLNGGDGIDTVSYLDDGTDPAGAATQGVSINMVAGTADDNWDYTDFLGSIEIFIGSNRSDTIGLGDIPGRTAYGMLGNDTLFGGTREDTLDGGGGDDPLSGQGGDDFLIGGAGNDMLNGGGGNDNLAGGSGGNSLNGGTGSDTADYRDYAGAGTQGVTVQLSSGITTTDTWGNGDSLTSIEHVNGSNFADKITGDGNDNNLSGFGGNDTLGGGGGNDTLVGGTGGDIFVIGLGGGNDTVADFENGIDKIDASALATSFAGMTVTQNGSDAVLSFGAGSPTLRLQNTSAASVDASDFVVIAQITGNLTGSVTEKSGVANGTAGDATASGDLDATDVDSPRRLRGAEPASPRPTARSRSMPRVRGATRSTTATPPFRRSTPAARCTSWSRWRRPTARRR